MRRLCVVLVLGLVIAFKQALQELGYMDRRSIAFEGRWAEGQPDRLPTRAGELVDLQVDVIVTAHTAATSAAKAATQTIPIVMAKWSSI